MSIPARPRFQQQGPDSRCIIDGRQLGWENCTPTSMAMAAEKATIGRVRLTGCDVRRATGDKLGGTTLEQCARPLRAKGVSVGVYVGSNVVSPATVAKWLRAGRGLVAQGNTGVLIGTPHRSTGGYVNHAVYVNEGRGWLASGLPTEVLVYDPAADGRSASWGRAAQGPQWWRWSTFLKFVAALRPWNDQRVLGPGKVYAAVFADTEPHVHLRYTGSKRTDPFPDAMTVRSPTAGRKVNVRSGPSTSYGVVATLATGATFSAYQVTDVGQLLAGSRRWYGDHDGKRWVHSSGLR